MLFRSAQTIQPRATVNDPLLDVMAECVPFMRTSMISSTGIKGVRVQDADQQQNVIDGSRSLEHAVEKPFLMHQIKKFHQYQHLSMHLLSWQHY